MPATCWSGRNAGQADWTAAYDPFCRRIWKAGGAKRTEFWWDTDRLIAERDETGRLRVYVYADHFALVPLLFVDYDASIENPADGRVYTVHTDQIGTPVEVRDEAGEIVWQAEIAPYGAATVRTKGIELNLRFPGHYHDVETGLHYNRFRYYAPTLGRYLQSDPIGVEGGLNLYAYPDRPLDTVDIRGRWLRPAVGHAQRRQPERRERPQLDKPGVEHARGPVRPRRHPEAGGWVCRRSHRPGEGNHRAARVQHAEPRPAEGGAQQPGQLHATDEVRELVEVCQARLRVEGIPEGHAD